MSKFNYSGLQSARILLLGVGGGGGNAAKQVAASGINGLEFLLINTDKQALEDSKPLLGLHIGQQITKGLSAAANPDVGRLAALEDRERIAEVLRGADMIFITAGMGGGTGTGCAPVVAEVAKELGILTVAVVTKPFPFEGQKRMAIADQGIKELQQNVDSLITIPNEKLLAVLGKNTSLLAAFKAANDVLLGVVQGIADLVNSPGMINVDFADVRTVMSEMGAAMMGTGIARGENRAREAAEAAIRSPLFEDFNLQSARGMLVNITAGLDLSLGEFSEVGDTIEEFASENATVVIGTVIDPDMGDELKVTVVATGLGEASAAVEIPFKVVETKKPIVDPTETYRDLDRSAVMRNQVAERDLEYLDIPAFLRRQSDDDSDISASNRLLKEQATLLATDKIKIIAPMGISDAYLVDLIQHLSNVYRSVGGDELIVDSVRNLPPSPRQSVASESSKKRKLSQ